MAKTTRDTFTNPNGSNYRQAQDLDLDILQPKLERIGISTIKIEQHWRHVTGTVLYQGQKYFFKMASTKGVGIKTKNEVLWNNFISSANPDSSLRIPKIYKTGKLNNLYYYLAEFVDGQSLSESLNHDDLQPILDSISRFAAFTSKSKFSVPTIRR